MLARLVQNSPVVWVNVGPLRRSSRAPFAERDRPLPAPMENKLQHTHNMFLFYVKSIKDAPMFLETQNYRERNTRRESDKLEVQKYSPEQLINVVTGIKVLMVTINTKY